jgi:cell fate regulator YaaT (PSP1 superfamily)
MGCASCGTGGGSPRGCKNNGLCSSGECDKLEVRDWLANLSLPENQKAYEIVEVRFKNARKSFYRNTHNFSLQTGDLVVVEATSGYDIGIVSVTGELARIQVRRKAPTFKHAEARKILRVANQEEINKWIEGRALEKDLMFKSRTLAVNLKLEMKISDVEYQADLSRATFYYTAEDRVDFRQLIKDMADQFKVRVEMRQIGSRQEASRLGGIGVCGRELCCSTWLTDFRSVSTSAARYQQLALNTQKLAGQCGKLKCCLNYELDMYTESLKSFPKTEIKLKTEKGEAYHIKTDVFKRMMWYAFPGESAWIILTPEQVKEVQEKNRKGVFPKDLKVYHVEEDKPVEIGFDNVVGQDNIARFANANKNRKKKKKKPKNSPQASNNA